jgi:hypothetical protein
MVLFPSRAHRLVPVVFCAVGRLSTLYASETARRSEVEEKWDEGEANLRNVEKNVSDRASVDI